MAAVIPDAIRVEHSRTVLHCPRHPLRLSVHGQAQHHVCELSEGDVSFAIQVCLRKPLLCLRSRDIDGESQEPRLSAPAQKTMPVLLAA